MTASDKFHTIVAHSIDLFRERAIDINTQYKAHNVQTIILRWLNTVLFSI